MSVARTIYGLAQVPPGYDLTLKEEEEREGVKQTEKGWRKDETGGLLRVRAGISGMRCALGIPSSRSSAPLARPSTARSGRGEESGRYIPLQQRQQPCSAGKPTLRVRVRLISQVGRPFALRPAPGRFIIVFLSSVSFSPFADRQARAWTGRAARDPKAVPKWRSGLLTSLRKLSGVPSSSSSSQCSSSPSASGGRHSDSTWRSHVRFLDGFDP
ncbi:hypothetical protein HPB48_002007 [Haemaphysalis longicornis]|uniref:Uncharacterized protein n=1 Tax=Haemaphysalis longicornis TaxID=44386 RepID=A0A9J6FW90_HAELO|nr:hypothetical protein HPB48_002007 [Haemaphysalis longicornis]